MEQEYGWAEVHAQFAAHMRQYRYLDVMQNMLAKAAQVEEYLNTHESEKEKMDEALRVARMRLIEVNDEYEEALDLLEKEKQDFEAERMAMSQTLKQEKEQCNKMIAQVRASVERETEQMKAGLAAKREHIESDNAMAQAALDTLLDTLEEADKKLAALRESL